MERCEELEFELEEARRQDYEYGVVTTAPNGDCGNVKVMADRHVRREGGRLLLYLQDELVATFENYLYFTRREVGHV